MVLQIPLFSKWKQLITVVKQESDEPKTVVNHKVQECSISPNQYPPSCHNVKQAPLSYKHTTSSLTFLIE